MIDEMTDSEDLEAVQGGVAFAKSAQTSSQADSEDKLNTTGVGCVATFQNSPLCKTPKSTLESLQESDAYPTPDEFTKTPLNWPVKPVETTSGTGYSASSHPTPTPTDSVSASTEEQAYEEFDL